MKLSEKKLSEAREKLTRLAPGEALVVPGRGYIVRLSSRDETSNVEFIVAVPGPDGRQFKGGPLTQAARHLFDAERAKRGLAPWAA